MSNCRVMRLRLEGTESKMCEVTMRNVGHVGSLRMVARSESFVARMRAESFLPWQLAEFAIFMSTRWTNIHNIEIL